MSNRPRTGGTPVDVKLSVKLTGDSKTRDNIRQCQQDVSNEHILDLLIALGGVAQQDHRCCCRDDVGDTDNRRLWHFSGVLAREGKQRGG